MSRINAAPTSRNRGAPPSRTSKVAPSAKIRTAGAKAPTRKVAAKKTTRRTREVAPIAVVRETLNKSELFNYLAEQVGLEHVGTKEIKLVWAALENYILGSLKPKGSTTCVLPGLVKFTCIKKPARKAGTLVRNPATGEMMKGAAKPASVRVKARALSKTKKAALNEI
jgi:nucleoid DNA-binding protein